MRAQYSGYSLIEIVIYVSLIGAMVVMSTAALISVYRTLSILRVEQNVLTTGDTVLGVMLQDIRAASGVNLTTSIFSANPGKLQVGAIVYTVTNGVLNRQEGASPVSLLTASGVRISNLILYRASSTISQIISVRLTLSAGSGVSSTTKQFYGSAVLRGTY